MRSKIYKIYKPILDSDDEKFNLKQQVFLQHYVNKNYDNIDKLLLYHGIGTGKTRSSILIAEEIMKTHPKMKSIIILPARLKTNYIDELIPIICKSKKKELALYYNIQTPEIELKKLRKYFADIIKKKYKIHSYEYITNLCKKTEDLKKTIHELTKNKIIIVDEFHNLIASKIDEKTILDAYNHNKIHKNSRNVRSLIMRLISRYADKSCKMFFLTATPIYDNIHQFLELVKLLNKKIIKDEKDMRISSLIPYIKDKISYYVDENKADFPTIKYDNTDIPFSKSQDIKTYEIMYEYDDNDDDDTKETFLIKQRQVSISIYGFDKVDKVLSNLDEYAPKLKKLFSYIETNNTGKHLIYSTFIIYCLHIIKTYLNKQGWVNYTDNYEFKPYKTYVLWDSSLNDNDKQKVKQVLNEPQNIDGKYIKVILGSPSIKEGISFKHIQHLHQIDPVWNASAKEQIEGRCIRYKSHSDIPLNHSYLKREVIIHNYKSVPIKDNKLINNRQKITETCDQRIYDRIIPNKITIVNKITAVLKKIAIDHYLYEKLSNSPNYKSLSPPLELNDDDDLYLLKRKPNKGINPKIKNNCPKLRRPIDNKCDDGLEMRLNKMNFKCCYKLRKKKEGNNLKGICPKPRMPINGKCLIDGYEIRKNKYDIDCCFKKKK
jgi:hypothetical protein